MILAFEPNRKTTCPLCDSQNVEWNCYRTDDDTYWVDQIFCLDCKAITTQTTQRKHFPPFVVPFEDFMNAETLDELIPVSQ